MENKVKRQHIVPATYLRKFCFLGENKKVVYAFNKQTKQVICIQPEKICKLKEFYESVEEEQILEEVFSSFEKEYNEIFNKIIKGINFLDQKDKEIIAKFTSLQFLRTESNKSSWSEIPNILLETEKNIAPLFKKQIEDALNPETIRKTNKKFILENFELFAEIILERKWILVRNKTKKPYWTSDNPITLYSPNKFGGLGLKSPESELYFPLSPEYCLLICDPEKCKYFPSEIESKEENVDFQRCLQVDYSNRFILSKENEFLTAHKRIKEVPEVSKLNRSSVKRVG
ncbi:DUF4238 domain-containing protein [Candidatus Pacearchaeota archaeon]|nr:DUF4238 domain-containing protein [Candidatus Pacearchaeota archaeon]